MKKCLKIILVSILLAILCLDTMSLAAAGSSTGKVMLMPSKAEVKSGEQFTVIVSQECDDGIIGIESNLDYDTEVFELKNIALNQNWSNLGEGTKLEAMTNNDITSGEVFTLTFSVKENVSATESQIKLTGIKLYKTWDDILELNDEATLINVNKQSSQPEPENPEVTLSKIEISKAPNKVDYTEGEKFSPTGLVINAVYSDGTKKEITNYTYSPNAELKTENKLITFSYQENGVTKSTTQAINVKAQQSNNNNNNNNTVNNVNANNNVNNTTNQTNNKVANNTTKNTTNNTTNNATNNTAKNTAKNATNNTDVSLTNSNLPKTGAETKYILLIVAGLIGVGFVSYIGYRKYKEI